ncbi:Ovarian tumor, otubain [Heracleum sosnowskyi]|uniref:ubiquitinyl hydrolase 1 n=1 Tax=Heracleum sosnowskyi TaxID=360622 RepID=A0AAD8IQU9_9APIA|nr:Ovarian tumor, otubain [Heracleum sosnowskyi]
MSEPDPDVARWGLHLLDVDQLFSSNYYGDTSHHDGTLGWFCYPGSVGYTMGAIMTATRITYNRNMMETSPILMEKLARDCTKLIPVPHVPKTNGDIPSIDEATTDHQRLLDRLQLYNLVECKVAGDGNCQFRALSDQFYRSPEHHKFVRRQIIAQLKLHPDLYEGYVPMAYGDYLKKMSKNGEWGDHITLQAASDSYGLKIFVLTSFKDTCSIEILPKVQMSKRIIFLSFWAEVHYNSIYPEGEMPEGEYKRKKGWSFFGNKH